MADTASILTGGVNNFATTSEMLNKDRTNFLSTGVAGVITNTSGVAPMTGALAVNAQGTPDMTVAVTAGDAIIQVTPTSQGSQKIIGTFAAQNVTIAANSTGGTRYDWIYAQASASGAAAPAADGTGVVTIGQSRSTSATTDNGTPPTYGTLLAIVTVTNGASSITNGNIADKRVRVGHVGGLNDTNNNEVIKTSATASAVNEFTATNAATAGHPTLSATGDDSNINVNISPKGTGKVTKAGYPIDWWEEIGRTTLGSAGDSISVTGLPTRKYLRVLVNCFATGGTIRITIQFNGDTGANYSQRRSDNNGADATATSQTAILTNGGASAVDMSCWFDVINVTAKEKFGPWIHTLFATGAGNTPERSEGMLKWANTAAAISRIDIVNTGTGDFNTGSEVVVLGHD